MYSVGQPILVPSACGPSKSQFICLSSKSSHKSNSRLAPSLSRCSLPAVRILLCHYSFSTCHPSDLSQCTSADKPTSHILHFPLRLVITPIHTGANQPTSTNTPRPVMPANKFLHSPLRTFRHWTIVTIVRGRFLFTRCAHINQRRFWLARETCSFCNWWRRILGGPVFNH